MTMSLRIWNLLACTAVLICGTSSLHAQRSAPDTTAAVSQRDVWINLSLGPAINLGQGLDLEGEYIGFGASVSYEISRGRMISGRAIYLADFAFWSPDDSQVDVGVLYGLVEKSNLWIASLGAGLGLARGTRMVSFGSGFREERYTSPAVPLEASVSLGLSSSFAIGAYGFANLNREQSFTGLLLVLQRRSHD